MVHFSFRHALDALTAISQGQLQGKILGMQERQQREAQEQQLRMQQVQPILQNLQHLDLESQKHVLEHYPDYIRTGLIPPAAPRNLGPWVALPNPPQGPSIAPQAPGGAPGPAPGAPAMMPGVSPPMGRNLLPPDVQRLAGAAAPVSEMQIPIPPTQRMLTAPRFMQQAAARTFSSPFGQLSFKTIDAAQAKLMSAEVGKAEAFLRQYQPASDFERQEIGLAVADRPVDFSDPEAYQKGRDIISLAARYSPGGALAVTRLQEGERQSDLRNFKERFRDLSTADAAGLVQEFPSLLALEDQLRKGFGDRGPLGPRLGIHRDVIQTITELKQAGHTDEAERLAQQLLGRIGARLSPQQEMKKEALLQKTLGGWDIKRAVNAAAVRKAYADAGLGYKAENMSDDELVSGGRARAEREYQRLLGRLHPVSTLTPTGQQSYLAELARMAGFAGRPNLVPRELVRGLPPGFQQRAKISEDRYQHRLQREAIQDQRYQERAEERARKEQQRIAKQNAGSVWKYSTPQEKSEYNSLNGPAWGPEHPISGMPPIYDESRMSARFLALRQKARARQNALVNMWRQRSGTNAPPSAPGRRSGAPVLPPATGVLIPPPSGRSPRAVAPPLTIKKVAPAKTPINKAVLRQKLIDGGLTPAEADAEIRALK